jgi:hypothetical protein
MAKSLLEQLKPFHERTRPLSWPFEYEGEERPMLEMRTLAGTEIGAAITSRNMHFKKLREQLPEKERKGWEPDDVAKTHRDRAEIVHRAFVDEKGKKLGTVDEVEALPPMILNTLFNEWDRFQDEVAFSPPDEKQMTLLIEELKKNTSVDLLRAWPSSWLLTLIRTLVSPPPLSTPDSSHG